jgi:hypothetical protein
MFTHVNPSLNTDEQQQRTTTEVDSRGNESARVLTTRTRESARGSNGGLRPAR